MAKNLTTKPKQQPEKLEGYDQLLIDIKSILEKTQFKVYKAVDNFLVQAYWQTGERIVREELKHKERADYGKRAMENLAQDLKLKERHIWRMVQFYRTYPILSSVMTELSWTHYIYLITISNSTERKFYEIQTIKNSWSTRELERRIKFNEYEKAKKDHKIDLSLPLQLPSPEEVFKDTYTWDFITLEEKQSEKDLEDTLIQNIEKTLLELGYGFAFIGRQQKIIIAGQIHTIDLVFYHRELQCIVLVDLKIGRFTSSDVGQMNKYLNYYKENNKHEWERNPVGLIVCKEKDKEEVHYALGGITNKIFVAEYKTKLPSEEEIKQRLLKE